MRIWVQVLWLNIFLCGSVKAEQVRLAAASDLVFCLEEINRAFLANHPSAEITATFGSSGNFYSQIRAGAPFDLFLSADISLPKRLALDGFAAGETLRPYAVGRLALWTLNTNISIAQGLTVLTQAAFTKIAIANPDHAPYGAAARAALTKLALWQTVQPKLVLADNIAQTAQFVRTGNAEVGIVALSLVLAPTTAGMGQWELVPDSLHAPLEQAAILTQFGQTNSAARAFLGFLNTPVAREIFNRFGFRLPVAAP